MSLLSTDKPNVTTHKWVIDNFAYIAGSKFAPTCFCPPDNNRINLHLWLHSNLSGYESSRTHVVIGLSLVNECTFQFPLSVKYKLSILDAKGEKHNTRDLSTEFVNKDSVDTQYNLNRNYLTDSANGLLVNGKLTIYCEVYAMDTVQGNGKSSLLTQNSKMSQDYGSLLKNGKFADVTLVVGEKDFNAHKLVLAARSPVFCAMFEHADTKESQENRVVIQDMSVEVFEQLIRFIYTDKVDSLEKYAAELLQAADRYQLDSLKCTSEQYLGTSLTIESLASVAVIADMHGAKKLERQCIDYLIKHVKEVTKTEGWKNLVESRPKLGFQLLQFVIDKN